MSVEASLETSPFDPSAELARLIERSSDDGAVVSFVGIARPQAKGGKRWSGSSSSIILASR